MKKWFEIRQCIMPLKGKMRQYEESYYAGNPWKDYYNVESTKELFDELQSVYGRCTSKVYVDDDSGNAVQVGWVFEQKQRYQDNNKPFIQETYITILKPCECCGHQVPGRVVHDVTNTPIDVLRNQEDIGYFFPW